MPTFTANTRSSKLPIRTNIFILSFTILPSFELGYALLDSAGAGNPTLGFDHCQWFKVVYPSSPPLGFYWRLVSFTILPPCKTSLGRIVWADIVRSTYLQRDGKPIMWGR